jgi:hypothetical protein
MPALNGPAALGNPVLLERMSDKPRYLPRVRNQEASGPAISLLLAKP